MSKAHVDPAELRRFAQDLGRFNTELDTMVHTMFAKLRSLESSWRDQEHHKFVEAFDDTARSLDRFLENSDEHVKFLIKKANAIDEYLKGG